MGTPQTAKKFLSSVFSWIRPQRPWFSSILAGSIFLIDGATKAFAPTVIINPGVSFGFSQANTLVFFISCLFLVLVLRVIKHAPVAWGLVLGGALGNLVDRAVFGGVRDWLPVSFSGLRNNLADWAIVLGLAWWGIMQVIYERSRDPVAGR